MLEEFFRDIAPGNTTELTAVNTLAEHGIVPASKSLVVDTDTVEGWDLSSKQEGFAIIDNVLVTVNDNDFGLEFTGLSKVGVVPLSGECVLKEEDHEDDHEHEGEEEEDDHEGEKEVENHDHEKEEDDHDHDHKDEEKEMDSSSSFGTTVTLAISTICISFLFGNILV